MLLSADQGPPRFAAAAPVVTGAMAEMRFPERLPVSQAAWRHRVLHNPGAYSGLWRESPHFVGFMDRAMDALGADSPYREVVVQGPSQTGKSEVGNNWQLHTAIYDPADMLFVMPGRVSIDEYVKTQWNKMLELCDDLAKRQLDGVSADTINLKMFLGCSFFFSWPTGPTFRSKPVSRGRVDDLDELPEDIADQGDALTLILGRSGSFSSYGGIKIYANSSPKRGRVRGRLRGIEALVHAGTNERWWVDCLSCGEPFELDTEQVLDFEKDGTPLDAAASAEVVCPHNGCAHRQRDKRPLMETGRWIGRGEEAVSRKLEPEGRAGELVASRRLSQRWDGLMGFRLWSDIAEQWRQADLSYENEQDEAPLKGFFQTVIGKNYIPKGSGEESTSEGDLVKRAKASPHRLKTVPAWARCVVMAVDQAINRFEVGVWAFAPGFRAALVDRYPILVSGDEPLQPFRRPEHFAVLYDKVITRMYPVAGSPELRVKPLCTVLDTGGMDGATENAHAWWYSMVTGDVGSGRPPLPASALMLFKGGNNPRGKLLPPPLIDAKRQIKGLPPCELFQPNVNRIKDMADVGLGRSDGGPGSITFPGDVDEHGELVAAKWIAEMKAEIKSGELWERPPNTPNETLDTYVMARTALLRFGGADHSLDWVPAWARPPRPQVAPAPPMESAVLREARGEEEPPAASPPQEQAPIVARAAPGRPTTARSRVRVTRVGR